MEMNSSVYKNKPGLESIVGRAIYKERYDRFVLIEMRKIEEIAIIEEGVYYIRRRFV